MPSAMMFPAGVSLLAMSVVRTRRRRIVCKRAFEEGFYRFVRLALHTAVDGDAGFGEGDSRTHADAAADERVRTERGEETRQRAVPVCGSGDDFRALHLPALDVVELERFGVSEVPENVAVQISDRDLHILSLNLHRLDCGCGVFRLEDGTARDDDGGARLFAAFDVGG